MKNIDSKTLLLIALPILAVFVYVIFFMNSSNSKDTSYKKSKVVELPDAKRDTTVRSKSEEYRRSEKKKDISNADFYELESSKEETKPQVQSKPERSYYSQESEAPVQRKKVKKASGEESPAPVVVETKPVVEESSFGISSSRSSSSATPKTAISNKSQDDSNSFFTAYLEDNTKIKNRQMVVFILSENATIEGHSLKKNSVLFGKASDTGNNFDIKINQAKNTDGTMIPFKNTYVYNEFYSRGIAHSGKMTKALKESGNNTVDDVSSEASSTVSIIPGADLAVSAVDNTIKAMSRQKENEISLSQGYKIYIKSE